MFDDAHLGDGARLAKVMYEQPDSYDFVDISQINSRNFDDRHWEVACRAIERNRPFGRPANHTKIYGGQPLPLQAPYKGGWVAAIVRA